MTNVVKNVMFNLPVAQFRFATVRKLFSITMALIIIFLLLTIADKQPTYAQEPTNAIYTVSSLAYSPDGTKIAVGGGKQDCVGERVTPEELANYAIRILDAVSGEVSTTLEGHTCATNSISWDSSGSYLASGGNDGSIRVWDVVSERQISIYGASGSDGEADPFEGVTWNPITSQIAGFQGSAILILDPLTGQLIKRITDSQDRQRIAALAWNPSGDLLATGMLKGAIKIWGVATSNIDQPTSSFDAAPIRSIAWSPDGSRIATGGDEGALTIFDASSGQILVSLSGHTQSIPSLTWSKDGSRLASASWDGSIRVWNAATGYQTDIFNDALPVIAVAWSPNNLNLAYGGTGSQAITIVTPSASDTIAS